MKKEKERLIKTIDIQHQRIEDLEAIIGSIAEIIHMQMPLRYQDSWLEMMVEQGLYVEPETEEILREQEQ